MTSHCGIRLDKYIADLRALAICMHTRLSGSWIVNSSINSGWVGWRLTPTHQYLPTHVQAYAWHLLF